MSSRACAFALAGMLVAPLVVAVGTREVAGQPSETDPAPARLTTDTAEYCGQLAAMLGTMTQGTATRPPPEVNSLSHEGERMCGEGQIRGGIQRLRQAVTIMRRHGGDQ